MEDWLKTAEVMQLCGWTHRGSVTRVARRENGVFRNPMSSILNTATIGTMFKRTYGIANEQLC